MRSRKAIQTTVGLLTILLLLVVCHITLDKTSLMSTPIAGITLGSSSPSNIPLGEKELIQNIRVVLEAKQTDYNRTEPVTILYTIANESHLIIRISRWDVPLDGLYNNTFRVVKDGQPIHYIGPLSMGAETTPENYLTLEPGEVISTTLDLALSYELGDPGEYIIQYESDILVMSTKSPEKLVERQDFIIKKIKSRAITIKLQEIRIARPSFVRPITNHCSQPQQEILTGDLQKAAQLACNAYQVLNTHSPDIRRGIERYLTWFGEYITDRYKYVTQNFNKMCYILSTQAITFECRADCDPILISSMTPNIEYEINLCNGFWELESSGPNSRPGAIIHEMSHFHVIADTDDVVYGEPSCLDLAKNAPEKAIVNAGSYKYFAENYLPLGPVKY